MRLSVVSGLVVALAASVAVASAQPFRPQDDEGPDAPRGLPGKPWPEARAQLAKLGYRPVAIVHAKDELVCERWPGRCREWPEVMDCSGTGEGYCAFLYRMPDGRLVQAVTSGEDGYERFEGLGWLPTSVLRGKRFVDEPGGKGG